MRILHYALGFPPYRSGGLTKFCVDLMEQQEKEGHEVSLLWPGEISLLHNRTTIKYHGKNGVINSFEIINPTPVPYDEGITEIEVFMYMGDESIYRVFLERLKPDIIHVHTLMGIHKALFTAAQSMNIRVVFSAHDFFPICPKVTMFQNGKVCENVDSCECCAECNSTALSLCQITILQSRQYRALKDVRFIKKLRKQHRDSYLSEESVREDQKAHTKRTALDYQILRNHYKSLVEMASVIHYNSSLTQSIYQRYLHPVGPKEVLVPITHSSIRDCKKVKQFEHDLRITYLGPSGKAKGFFMLRDALERLWNDKENGRQDFCLNIYFQPPEQKTYMKIHDRYSYSQLGEIFENTDVLVAPSILYETFGYTVLEALSYGVPVIVSDTVGAKDVIPDGSGIIVKQATVEKLTEIIREISKEKLCYMNQTIMQKVQLLEIATMSERIMDRCYR